MVVVGGYQFEFELSRSAGPRLARCSRTALAVNPVVTEGMRPSLSWLMRLCQGARWRSVSDLRAQRGVPDDGAAT